MNLSKKGSDLVKSGPFSLPKRYLLKRFISLKKVVIVYNHHICTGTIGDFDIGKTFLFH